jgi:hypothetical protein
MLQAPDQPMGADTRLRGQVLPGRLGRGNARARRRGIESRRPTRALRSSSFGAFAPTPVDYRRPGRRDHR